MTRNLICCTILCLTLLSAASVAQTPFAPDKMDTVLYGAAYYPEYMPHERLDKDVELMKQAGISVVRIGESSWGLWEPEDGRFEYAWMDRVVDRMQKAGIKVIMGTPTYSIPAWMYKKHPEIVMTRLDGKTITYGMRQNADLLNPTYRFYCERIIRKLAEHYKDNRTVIGWQIDNETPPGGAANKDVQDGFVEYLQHKFKTVDELNKVWGLNYWGQRLNDWTEIPPESGILNSGWKLEWQRYAQWITTDFLAWQASIVDQYKRPDQFVTQDFAGPPRPEVNEYDISKSLDIVAVNPYHHAPQDEYDGEDSSYQGDFSRSLKQTNYLVTETNADTIGWDSKSQFPPYDGQLRLDVYTHLSSGANMVEYWHWHSIHYGQETYWKGILGHDLEPGRPYQEMSRTAHELATESDRLGGQFDAYTSHEMTGFDAKVVDTEMPHAFDLLSDLVLNPRFDADDLVKEQKVIIEEMKMIEDTPDELLTELFHAAYFPDHFILLHRRPFAPLVQGAGTASTRTAAMTQGLPLLLTQA